MKHLLEITGVVAALRYNDDGSLVESIGELDRIHAELAAEMFYANGRIVHQGADILISLSGMGGWPPHGWMLIGGKLSVCAVGNVACIVRNGDASFNAVFRVLEKIINS